jgi:hypothetical protein
MSEYHTETVRRSAVPESPLKRARRVVERELRNLPNNPNDEIWLSNHPVLWLRALAQARRELERKRHDERSMVDRLKPQPGQPASDIYLRAKAAYDARADERSAREALIRDMIEDVKVLLGDEPVTGWLIPGDLCMVFLEIVDKAEAGDLDGVAEQARYWADKWAEQEVFGTTDARDTDVATADAA